MIKGISHITFIVRDLDRTANFLEGVFEAKEVYSSPTVKYFLLNDLWIALNKGVPLPGRTYNHIAFTIAESDMDEYIKRIEAAGVEIKQGRARNEGEGKSIYFHDFDNHLFELHTGSLYERLNH
ncbi:MAG: VOC family protein [Defluviitaleaceae bacterium]|nr:VOC family protein [Defluviitaleaceae bacterium]